MAKHNLELTPIMSLSMFAIFAMMIPIFSLSNNAKKTRSASASNIQAIQPIENIFCGGATSEACPSGLECVYENGRTVSPYPDAEGECLIPAR